MTHVLGKTDDNKSNKTSDEERQSFLFFSSPTDDPSVMSTVEAGGWQRGATNKGSSSFCKPACTSVSYSGVYLLLTVALLVVTVLSLELYRGSHDYVTRKEMEVLRRDLDRLQQRIIDRDVLGEMKAFEDTVYAEENVTDDDDGEYADYEVANPEDLQHDVDDHHAKHLNTDLPDQTVDKRANERTARLRREAYGRIEGGGLPVVAGSYGVANRTEGLRLYESLVADNQEVTTETTETPIKKYHRVSPLWSPKQHRKKYRQPPSQSSEDDTKRDRVKSTLAPSPIISRPSRVMKTDKDPSRRVSQVPSLVTHTAPPLSQELKLKPGVLPSESKKNHEGEILFRVYQEQRAVPESTVKPVGIVDVDRQRRRNKSKPQRKTLLSSIEGVEPDKAPTPMRHRLLPAAHFIGDTSRYTQAHEHYDGNGRLRHPDGVFTDWAASQWVQQLGMDRHFKYEDGAVKIKDTGLYFVYAQIHYLDEHDINGYRVYVNEDPMMQCTTMTHSMGGDRIKKSNSCFTAAALFLMEDDRLSLSDIGGLRYSLFEPTKSFFGLIKLGSVNLK